MNNNLKHALIEVLIAHYEKWGGDSQFSCHRGCSVCCTQNVNMTALEGEEILRYVINRKMEKWLSDRLGQGRNASQNTITMNGYARACLEHRDDTGEDTTSYDGTCPFLENDECAIYPCRPLACRCLVSTVDCRISGVAEMPESFMAVNNAAMQIAEHIGQKEYWGNMIDVLLALLDIPEYSAVLDGLQSKNNVNYARARLLRAEPLSGFLFMPEEAQEVQSFLDGLLSEKIDNRTVDQILNNR